VVLTPKYWFSTHQKSWVPCAGITGSTVGEVAVVSVESCNVMAVPLLVSVRP
jgi:hypothetical protein